MKLALPTLFTSLSLSVCQRYTRCGTGKPAQWQLDQLDVGAASTLSTAAAPNILTYVHVVTTQAKQGTYTQTMINKQLQVMNSAYSQIGVSFNLAGTDFTVNNAWAAATPDSAEERSMKQALRKGTYSTLNLYFLSDLGGGLLGFCNFPVANPTADDRILDGCINLADSLPGGVATNYNLGYTAVHETGHWFGLYHVFQTLLPVTPPVLSCLFVGKGDYVDDTPAQITASQGCPEGQDSCPYRPGLDSVHNYMDYSYDTCMNQFTPGQATRAKTLYQRYRAGK